MSSYANLFASLFEFARVDRLGLVGAEQALPLAIESAQLRLTLLVHSVRAAVECIGLSGPLLELGSQCGRIVEQALDMAPDGGVEFLGLGPGLRTAALAVASDGVLAVTHVVTMHASPAGPAGGDAEHGQTAGPASGQAAKQIVVAGVVAGGEGRVSGELLACMMIIGFVDDGGHRDGDPLPARARFAAGRQARPRAGGPGLARHDELVAVGVRRPGVKWVGEGPVHDAVGPEPLAVARSPRAIGQPLEDLADGRPLVDQPAVEHPDDFGLGLVDHEISGDSVPFGDVTIAIGGAAGTPLAGPGLLELAAAEPLGEDGPLVLGDRPLDLEQELVVRVVRDRPPDELDSACGPAEFLKQEDLVGVTPGQPVGGIDRDDLELTLTRGITEAIECRAVEPRPRVTLIDVNMLVFEIVALGGRPASRGVELAVNRLVPPLLVGRDSGVDRGSHGLHSDDEVQNCSCDRKSTRAGPGRPGRVAWDRHDGGRKWSGWPTPVAEVHGIAGARMLTSLEVNMAGTSRVGLGLEGKPRGEAASRGPERNHERRPQCIDCVRMVHVIKDINRLVPDAVRRLRTAMNRRGKAGRKKKRGREGAKSKAAAARRGMTVKEKAHFVFERRHLIVKRRENLTEAEHGDLTRMLEHLPELATLRRFADRIYWLFDTPKDLHQAGCRRAAVVRDAAFQGVPELVKAMEQVDAEKLPKLMAYLKNPLSRRVRTNNHVERTNRMFRFLEKVRYKWRRRKTLVRFVVLTLDGIWGQRTTAQAKVTDRSKSTGPGETEDGREKRPRAA
jgi:hypothetical protein